MPFLLYEQILLDTAAARTIADLNPPTGANGAMLQAQDGDLNYTMDGITSAGADRGEILQDGLAPEEFKIEDMRNISIAKASGADTKLNVHWFGGRAI